MLPDEEIIKKRTNLGKEKKSLDTLFNLLKIEKPEGVGAEFVVESIMKMKGVRGPMCEKIAVAHIGDDPRFEFAGGVFKVRGGVRAKDLFNAPSYCVVDVETAGRGPKEGAIIEIAAVRVANGSVADSFSRLVDPGFPISPEDTKIHGITDDMVAGMPPIDEVLPAFLDFLGDSVFVAHNAPFDLSYINEALGRKYSQKMINPVICTLKLSRMLYPNLESHSLERVVRALRIKGDVRHRALDDAKACAGLLLNLLNAVRNGGVPK